MCVRERERGSLFNSTAHVKVDSLLFKEVRLNAKLLLIHICKKIIRSVQLNDAYRLINTPTIQQFLMKGLVRIGY